MEGVQTVRFRRRKAGDLRRVTLLEAAGERPAIVLEFETPDPLAFMECEAIAKENLAVILRNPQLLARYGFPEKAISEDQALGLRDKVFLIEAAVRFWRDINVEAAEGDTKLAAPLIAELLLDPFISGAWQLHLMESVSLDFSEGNASGASPGTNSGEAPSKSADLATSPPPAAPEASPPATP